MYHIDDLPFSSSSLPDIYTQFRKVYVFFSIHFESTCYRRESLTYKLVDNQTQSVESKSAIRSCIKVPASLGPTPDVKDWGCIPETSALGIQLEKACNIFFLTLYISSYKYDILIGLKVCGFHLFPLMQVNKGMAFAGGESAALSRVHEYFWKKVYLFS